jgi:hypothetical protein
MEVHANYCQCDWRKHFAKALNLSEHERSAGGGVCCSQQRDSGCVVRKRCRYGAGSKTYRHDACQLLPSSGMRFARHLCLREPLRGGAGAAGYPVYVSTTSAYVRIRQHTSAYVSIRRHGGGAAAGVQPGRRISVRICTFVLVKQAN